MNVYQIQSALNATGFDAGPVDGLPGKRTEYAIRSFQRKHRYPVTGILTSSEYAFLSNLGPKKDEVKVRIKSEMPGIPAGSTNWPHQRDVPTFFGSPGNPLCTQGVVHLVAPMRIAWDLKSRINNFRCHTLVATHMTTIFAESVRHYGEDRWRALGLDIFGGCFNVRAMRGGTNYSMHSWGIAVDLDPTRNQLKWNRTKAQFAKDEYVPFWNIVESTGAVSLGRARDFDWMHFQFARIG